MKSFTKPFITSMSGHVPRQILGLSLLALTLSGCSNDRAFEPEPLPSGLTLLNIDPFSVSISGISSGAYMAQIFHLAHSERVSGVGLIGVGPYDCARGDLGRALSACMGNPTEAPDVALLMELAQQRAGNRDIQPLTHLANDHVWMLHGENDATVGRRIFNSAVAFYEQLIEPQRLNVVYADQAGHLWPTESYGVDCASSDSPYLGACGYDAAGQMLKALYGYMHQPSDAPGELIEFNQYQAGAKPAASFADTGYAYVPEECADGKPCSLHISLHGCNQHSAAIEDRFAAHNGLNRWAEANRIVVLYPQVEPSQMNPQGCWDWWGYTDSNYASVDGAQVEALVAMINHIAGVDSGDLDTIADDLVDE